MRFMNPCFLARLRLLGVYVRCGILLGTTFSQKRSRTIGSTGARIDLGRNDRTLSIGDRGWFGQPCAAQGVLNRFGVDDRLLTALAEPCRSALTGSADAARVRVEPNQERTVNYSVRYRW